MADNPLLEKQFRIPFDAIRAEHVRPAIEQLIGEAKERLQQVIDVEGPRTWENTMWAYEQITDKLDHAMGIVSTLESVATTPEWREAYNDVEGPYSEFHSMIPLNEGLWNALREYSESGEAKQLTGTRKRFLEKTIRDFRREGADLDPAGKQRLAEIDQALTRLTTKFSQNVLDATNEFELFITEEKDLAGLPQSAVDAARADAGRRGKAGWRFTLQEPSYIALMVYLDKREIREQVYRAHATRASRGKYDNRDLIREILELRAERAKLLGFKSFPDLVLAERMAKSGEKAKEFLADLRRRSEPMFHKENEELEEFRRELEGQSVDPMQPWDVAYYSEKLRKHRYDYDEEAIRPYFPAERVIAGMFEVVQRLYGIDVAQVEDMPAWHEDVRAYAIRKDGRELGRFYMDLYPRESKRGGAWMSDLMSGEPLPEGGRLPNLGLIAGNLTPPVGDKPALLTHREVETLFHEFGHLLHHCLSEVDIPSLAGTNVAWDFVELPSQLMENWCWEREALDLFARHHESGEPLPEDLFAKMLKARNFRSANFMMRQLGFGTVDLALHTEFDPKKDDVFAFARGILQQFSAAPLPGDYAMIAGFGHLFAGPVAYASGYYSYKWAEVLDADVFTRFKEEGLLSRDVGQQFLERLLSRGNSRDPMELFRDFMGREPDLNALLARSGLLEEEAA